MIIMLKIFLLGLAILFSAIVLNFVATKLSITGWYEFLQHFGKKEISILSYAWLFLIYPFALGLTAYLSYRLLFG